MTALQSLRSLSAYPIPPATLQDIAEGVGMAIDAELTREQRQSADFKRAKAQVYLFLSEAPDVTQNGISYSFNSEERRRLRTKAESLLDEIGETDTAGGITCGYIGEDL